MFLLVIGNFPFPQATKQDKYYNLLCNEKKQRKYWKVTGASKFSDDFKDLMASMVSYDPEKRPSLTEIENHPWMKTAYNHEKVRNKLIKEMDW